MCLPSEKDGSKNYSRVFEVQELLLLEDMTSRRIAVCRELVRAGPGIEYSVDLAERRIYISL